MIIDLADRSYEIIIERDCLARSGELLDLDRKCLLVTDEGVPSEYIEKVAAQCRKPVTLTIAAGEASKSIGMLEKVLSVMLQADFTRSDCVIAVGGGMPGDLAGFAAATYMRGIDFYNVPTTLLSQADSSIGGKTAVNLNGVKNIVGAFWQPRGVLIDPDTLTTLNDRHKASGLAEVIKAGLIADAGLFGYLEKNCSSEIDAVRIVTSALKVKKAVVEADERESSLRRILNFGHTIGHGIESVTGMLHGECVAIGMMPMCSEEVRQRLAVVLEQVGLPVSADCDPACVFDAVMHDKKIKNGEISTVYVTEPGRAEIRAMTPGELRARIESICKRSRQGQL